MKLALGCLASGSSGNSYLIKSENINILVDAGISGRRIKEGLKGYGIENGPENILLTHEHTDHIQGLPPLLKGGARVYVNGGTAEALSETLKDYEYSLFKTGEKFILGDVQVSSFPVSHDAADPVGFSFEKDGACISIITDTGYVTDECFGYMRKSDILVLESNHDESMLRIGRYPWFLKQRILGKEGHLSNEAASKAVAEIMKADRLAGEPKYRKVLLAHLSRENNFPQMAIATMSNIMETEGFSINRDLSVEILSRDQASKLYII